MKNENLEEMFRSLDFDIAEPAEDHEMRFRKKLQQRKRGSKNPKVISLWLPWMAIAASFLIAFIIFQNFNGPWTQKGELASVSSEMENTQNFYSSVIKKELYALKQHKSPETEIIIQDALDQLHILETDYESLKVDLVRSGQNQRVIYAMISNFQQRIDLLQTVLEKVNSINTLKNKPNENHVL